MKVIYMNRLTRLGTTTALVTLIASAPALADITAKEAWDGWNGQLTKSGFDVSYDAAMSADILTINNLTISKGLDDGQGQSSLALGPLGFRERGDGTVEVIFTTDTPVVLKTSDAMRLTFNQHQTGLTFIISGTVDEMQRDIRADEITLNLIEMVENDEVIDGAKIDLILTNLSGNLFTRTNDRIEVVSEFSIGNFTYDFDMKERGDKAEAFVWAGSVTGLHGSTDIAAPDNIETATPTETIVAGMRFKVKAGYAAITSHLASAKPDEGTKPSRISFSSTDGSLAIALGTDTDGLIEVVQKLSLGALSFDADITDTRKDLSVTLEASLADINANIGVKIPDGFSPEQMPAALEAGFAITAGLSHRGINGTISSNEDGQMIAASTSTASANTFFSFDRKTLWYEGRAVDTNVSIETDLLPVPPLQYSIADTSFNLMAPVDISTKPEPFTFQFNITDFWISNGPWDLLDPAAHLSREPATMNLDISGMGNWLVDVMDIESEAVKNTEIKGELHALTLNALQIAGVGINLTGAGDFTFNNADLETFAGMPAPAGTVDLKLTGGNTLIDTLIEMGLLPADEAMGVRMALSLFTIAGDGDDTLISELEVTQNGQVLANGKRLK